MNHWKAQAKPIDKICDLVVISGNIPGNLPVQSEFSSDSQIGHVVLSNLHGVPFLHPIVSKLDNMYTYLTTLDFASW